MRFFHVYNERSFEGLVKNDLINEDSGFKIQHIFSMPAELKFNRFAAKDTRLHRMIKEGRYPFYVDRIAGGTTYHEYDFDPLLLDEYRMLLDDWFLGIQLHESASNRRHDWMLIMERMEGATGPYDPTILRARSVRESAVMPDGTVLPGLSQGTPELYANMQYATTPEAFHREISEMFSMWMKKANGRILPCDSFFLYTHMQNQLGMRSFMPEVGCQIPQMRIEVALARGIARAAGKRWGVYYETWIGNLEEGYSMPCFNNDLSNEWYLTQETHEDDFTTKGQNGGSSRRLQKRIYYHALMSGADYFSEEWGLNCSYSNMNTFALSPYGIAKKEFIEQARTLRGMRAITPFAIVLPVGYEAIELPDIYDVQVIGEHRKTYLHCKLNEAEQSYYGHIEDVLKLIYARSQDIYGNESHVLTNSRFGDLFDIVYDDLSDDALARYEYLIDTTPDGEIARLLGKHHRVLESADLDALAHRLHELERTLLPISVDSLHWLLSEDENGKRYLSIFNNEGNERSVKHGDVVRHEADATITVTLFQDCDLTPIVTTSQDITVTRTGAREYRIQMPATELAIFTF